MRRILSVEVENTPGILARVAGLFSARGFNIDSLAVGETESPDRSRMTIVVTGDRAIVEQIRKQLAKLIDTIRVVDLTGEPVVERDLALIKLRVPPGRRLEVAQLAELFRARVVDVSPRHMIVEISGREEKLNAFIDMLASMSGDARNPERDLKQAFAKMLRQATGQTPPALAAPEESAAPPGPGAGEPRETDNGGFAIVEMARTGRVAIKRGGQRGKGNRKSQTPA